MAAGNFAFHAELAKVGGGAQTDPNDSLGGQRSGTNVEDLEGTITAVASTSVFTDSSQISAADWTGAWLVFYDGTLNVNVAREVVDFDDSTGEFTVSPTLPELPVVAQRFRAFRPNGLFDAFSSDKSVSMVDRHRLSFAFSDTTFVSAVGFWVRDLQPGPLTLELAASPKVNDIITAIGDESQAPDIVTSAGGLINPPASGPSGSQQVWLRPAEYATQVPVQGGSRQLSNQAKALWLRLRWRGGSQLPRPQRCVFQVMLDTTTASSTGSFMVVVDILGPVLEFGLGPDRALRIAGGARVQANVRDVVTQAPVPDYTATIELVAPSPGSIGPQNQDVTTDDGVVLERVYTSPVVPPLDDVEFKVEVF